jgi:hypothetical protein
VVIFSPFKTAWRQAHNGYEYEARRNVNKKAFLSLLAKAWLKVMTPSNILSTFRKTRVSPFNEAAINKNQLAPSKETTIAAALPFALPKPAQALLTLIQLPGESDDKSDGDRHHAAGWEAHLALKNTSAAFLLNKVPITLAQEVVPMVPVALPRMLKRCRVAMPLPDASPETQICILSKRVDKLEANGHTMRKTLRGMYAHTALQDVYCAHMRNQLFGKEEEDWEKEDGNPCLDTNTAVLMSRKFTNSVKKKVTMQKSNCAAKEAKATQMDMYRHAKAQWEKDNKSRVARRKLG